MHQKTLTDGTATNCRTVLWQYSISYGGPQAAVPPQVVLTQVQLEVEASVAVPQPSNFESEADSPMPVASGE